MSFLNLIKPAILAVLAEADEDGYRRERDLHHHLTVCLHQVSGAQLRIGRRDRRVRYEEPTKAKYSWRGSDPKAGNIDFFFSDSGTAMEVNLDYVDVDKIKQDFIKLLDPRNEFSEAVYFAWAKRHRLPSFKETVQEGLEKAFQALREETNSDFALPVGLYILVLETNRSRPRGRLFWEACPTVQSIPNELSWSQIQW